MAAIRAHEDISKILKHLIVAPDKKKKPYAHKFLEKNGAMRLVPVRSRHLLSR